MEFINIGFGNLVNPARVIYVISPDSAPAKRMVQEAKANGMLIDATQGRKTHSVIITDSDNIILSYLDLQQMASRFGSKGGAQ